MAQTTSLLRSFLGFCRRWFAAEPIHNPRSLQQVHLDRLILH